MAGTAAFSFCAKTVYAQSSFEFEAQEIFPDLTGNQLLDSLFVHYRPQMGFNYSTARAFLFGFVSNDPADEADEGSNPQNGVVVCVFTGNIVTVDSTLSNPHTFAYETYNFQTEHVWPQSRGAAPEFGLSHSDLHHLRPIRGDVNVARSNFPFGFVPAENVARWWKGAGNQTTVPADPENWSRSSSGLFQVRDIEQGDIARHKFYFYAMYPQQAIEAEDRPNNQDNYFINMMQDLRTYHNADPIDEAEWIRNQRIASLQGNVNPFVVDTTLVRRAFFENYDHDVWTGPNGYFVDFDRNSNSSYAPQTIVLNHLEWGLDNILITGQEGDRYIGLRSARFRHQTATPASMVMLQDKENGLGTIQFLYSRSGFGGDQSGNSPVFVVEYSTDAGESWTQAGSQVSLAGVDELTRFRTTLNIEGEGRVRIRTISGDNGKRFNIDDFQITDFSNSGLATVTQPAIESVRFFQIGARAEITDDGNTPVFARGFIAAPAATSPEPDPDSPGAIVLQTGDGTGSFEGIISGLTPGETYAVRSFAENAVGTSLSSTVTITLPDTFIFAEALRNGALPSGWQADEISFETAADGYARFNETISIITTPTFDASAFAGIQVALDVAKWGSGGDGPITLSYSLDAGLSWQKAGDSSIPDNADYLSSVIDIEEVSNQMQLRFSRLDSPSRKRLRDVTVTGTGEVFIAQIGSEPSAQVSGFRMLSSPVEIQLSRFLAPLWTQGAAGSDAPNTSDSSIFRLEDNSFVPVNNLNVPFMNGEAVLVYVFEQDEYGSQEPPVWPKILTAAGSQPQTAVAPALQNLQPGAFNLIGNPFGDAISFDAIARSEVMPQVFVYDTNFSGPFDQGEDAAAASGGGWRTWNGTAGSLEKGHIAAFQGFLVRNMTNTTETRSVTIPADAQVLEGELYRDPVVSPVIQLALRFNGGLSDDFWLAFSQDGSLSPGGRDIPQLYPVDSGNYLMFYSGYEDQGFSTRMLPDELYDAVHLPLYVTVSEASGYGTAELIWPVNNHLPEHWDVLVRNNATSEIIDLRKQSSYQFSMQPGLIGKRKSDGTSNPMIIESVVADKQAFAPLTLIIDPRTTSVVPGDELPRELSLDQNYPNPFNPTTQIQFALPVGENVRLEVYNIQGQLVSKLIDGMVTSGRHTITFDASALSSGVYIYRLRAGNTVLTRKMTLIK